MAFRRYDAGSTGRVEVTPQGGLRVPAVPTRSGVFPYTGEGGKQRLEYRPPDEVFHADSLATLRAAPVTHLHPTEQVTAANWRALAVGHVTDAITPDLARGEVGATLVIQDQEMVSKVGSGWRELSCGYSCDLELTPGVTPQGQKYDAIQRNIRYNHVGLGPPGWGRQGPDSSLRLDSGDAFQSLEVTVEKETIDGVEYTVGTPEHLAALRKARDTAAGRADAAEKAIRTAPKPQVDPKVVHAQAQIRADLLVKAHQVAEKMGRKFDAAAAAAASNDQIIGELIGMIDPNFDVNGKTPDYLAGALTMMIRGLAGAAMGGGSDPAPIETPAPATLPGDGTAPKTDGAVKVSIFGARAGTEPVTKIVSDGGPDDRYDSDAARTKLVTDNQARWRKPLAMTK